MRISIRAVAVTAALTTAAAVLAAAPASAGRDAGDDKAGRGAATVRVATYNLSLNRAVAGELEADLSTTTDTQAQAVAEVIQRTRPDIVLLNEFDYVEGGVAADLFRENYLEIGQGGADPIEYRYAFVAPSNTGIPTGFDLNNDGTVGGGDDAYGFGLFPGQYGMAVLSKYPIAEDDVRTFQNFLWKDMPGALLPTTFYSPEEQNILRLSSKSHWDVPVQVGRRTVHVLVSHPTPPTFDGPEDRNGTRNHDEIRFWAEYVGPGRANWIYDDEGVRGGLKPGSPFVIMGDQNSDPVDGDSVPGSIQQLLENPRVVDPLPTSAGAPEAALLQGGANTSHEGDPRYDTADFADTAPGNLRADYVLPSRQLRPVGAGVFWPVRSDPLSRLTGEFPFPTSDHRLVWVDVRVPGGRG